MKIIEKNIKEFKVEENANLLIEGCFDIFHDDHRKYIKKCIDAFKKDKGVYPTCLRVDIMSNIWTSKKGIYRPFLDEKTRESQVYDFIKSFQNKIPMILTGISSKASFEYSNFNEVKKIYPEYKIALCADNKEKIKAESFNFLEVSPLNTFHTSDIEKRLLSLKNISDN